MFRTEIVVSYSSVIPYTGGNTDLHFCHPRLKGYFRTRLCVFFLNLCGLSAYIHEEVENDI